MASALLEIISDHQEEMKLARCQCVMLLAGLVAVAYSNGLPGDFVWDDEPLVCENNFIRNSIYIPAIFTTDLFHANSDGVAYYRPLQTLSLMADYFFWGLNPVGYHLTNVLLHLLCVLLVWLLVLRIAGNSTIALIVASLFAVHPVNTNAITYIAGRADPLAFAFILAALLLWLHPKRTLLTLTGALLCYTAALFSRENAMLFPALLAVYCLTVGAPAQRKWRFAIEAAAPFALLAIAFISWRTLVLSAQDKMLIPHWPVSPTLRSQLVFRALATYIELLFWPARLQMERQVLFGDVSLHLLTATGVAWAALLVAGIVWSYRRMPVVCFGLCWFVITLLPMTGLLNLPASIAEHWLYVPSVGFYLAVCALGRRALERVAISPRLVFAACVLVTVSLTWRTILRNSDWLDPVRLYTVTKRAAPHSDRARNNLARELHNAGNSAQARAELLAAERIAPRDLRVKRNLAAIELAAGNLDAALAKTEECLRLAPNDVESQLRLAEIHEQRGDFASARYHYLAGMAGRQDISTRLRYGAFLLSHHRLSEAMQVAGEAYDLEPGNADVFNLIGAIETERGRAQTGRKAFEMACALDRHSPASFVNLARAALMAGDAASATGSLLRALRIQPENAKARYLLAIALWKQAERAAAERELCRAQQLAPGSSKIASALERLREGEPCGELASL